MPASARSLQLEQALRTRLAATVARTHGRLRVAYRIVDEDRIRATIGRYVDQAAELIAAGQRQAQAIEAAFLGSYLSAELEQTIATPQPLGRIVGTTADGRRLGEALAATSPLVLGMIARGRSPADALAGGLASVLRLGQTEVTDAAWREMLAHMQAREGDFDGWTWVTSGRSCGACLAQQDGRPRSRETRMGKHPGCDCVAAPIVAGAPQRVARPTGVQLFARMTPDEQAATLKTAGAEKAAAIRDGRLQLADLVRVEEHASWRPTITEATPSDLGI